MKDKFRGWGTVFGFTFRQSTKGIGFRLVTVLVALLIAGLIVLLNILAAKPDKENELKPSPVKTVIVMDQSGLVPTDYKAMNPELSGEKYNHIEFVNSSEQSREETIKAASLNSPETLAVIITAAEDGYDIEAVIPDGSDLRKKEVQKLLGAISISFEANKMLQAGLTVQQLNSAIKPAVTSYVAIGENTSQIVLAIKMIAPMLFGFMLYMMLLLYGQNVSKSISTEKTSKLIETLLTSVHPYALIFGKVLAVTTMALIQFIIWIIAAIIGLYGGNVIAHSIYPEYENTVITIINFVKDNIGETAMSLPAVILAVIFFVIGFLYYCTIAGLVGSFVSKPEDVASTQAVFQFPVVISFLVCYLAPVFRNEGLQKIARYIPFTSPFSVPADLITGTIGLGEGVLYLGILVIFSFFVILLSARIFKGFVLYTGQKLSLKLIGNILKSGK